MKLDHITVIAPSLEEGRDYVERSLGVQLQPGGKHLQMGTHNLFLKLGDDLFLEIIAKDPDGAPIDHPRWFGLDDTQTVRKSWDDGFRLRAWVASTNDIFSAANRHGPLIGIPKRITRGDRSWLFAVPDDGSLPANGLGPSVIDWEGKENPARSMIDTGARLDSFEIIHPRPTEVHEIYSNLGIIDPPKIVQGDEIRYRATINTPSGQRSLL